MKQTEKEALINVPVVHNTLMGISQMSLLHVSFHI